MGQTLTTPCTTKSKEVGANERVFYGLTSMQGWRITMEDAHAVVLDLEAADGKQSCFFAVYDGHGGSTVAKFAGQNVHRRLVTEEAYKNDDYEVALKKAFLGTDEDLLANPAHTRDPSGCTAVAALLTHDNKIYVANAGDSRSVLGVKGAVKPLSFDHKPTNEGERARISGAGGYVEFGRVNGNLALSRALGDFQFKKNYSLGPQAQIITADPDVTCHEITEEDEFLVIACDGIWDCVSSQGAIDFVRYQVSQGKELTEIGEMICEYCLAPDTTSGAGIGCDNMTVLIVAITHGRSKEEWYAWITDRVKKNYGYETPSTLPQLYAHSRLMAFRATREAYDKHHRALEEKYAAQRNASSSAQSPVSSTQAHSHNDTSASGSESDDELPGLKMRVMKWGPNGPTLYPTGGDIGSHSGELMFVNEDNDDDDDDLEEDNGGRSFFTETLGLGRAESPDLTRNLKAQLIEYEKEIEHAGTDNDKEFTQDEKPSKLPNGDAENSSESETPSTLSDAPEPVAAQLPSLS
jgi:protein phosphatase 2C family protein 2/3